MIRLQRWESGPYFTAFSLRIPDMRVEIGKICPRSPIVSLSNTQVRQAPSLRYSRCPEFAMIIGSRCRLVKNVVLHSGMHKNIFFL